ncbi:MAG TPA: YkvA family protein [Actinomycetales bacterium]|nr:YkvA family protein [Actinomycetales bacterium]
MVEKWAWLLGIAVAVVLASWGVMVLLARRLPPGVLRDVAAFLPACVTAARRLRRDSRVPTRAKIALLVAVVWVVSPIDLIPEFLPVIGPLDDVVAVVLLLRYAARSIPRPVLLEAWPEDPRLLERVLDGRRRRAET